MTIRFRFSDTGRVWEPAFLNFRDGQGASWWTPRRLAWAVLIAAIAWMVLSSGANAQVVPLTNDSVGIFDAIQEQYMKKATTWEAGLRKVAMSLFGGLAVISLAWTFIKIMLQKNEATAFIPTMTLQIMTLGFFYFLVEHGTEISLMILQSFTKAGEQVGGGGIISPSNVAIAGMECVFRVIEKAGDLGLSDKVGLGLPLLLCGLVLCFAFVGVSILLLVTVIESYFVLYGGIIMLGFGALPWTRDIPKNYLIYAINVGVKIFVLSLIVTVGVDFSAEWPEMIRTSTTDLVLHTTIYLMAGALVFLAVAWKVPGIAAALTSGSVNFNASDILGTSAAAAGMGAAAGAVATGGLSTLATAAKGGLQAVSAGTSLAAQQGASGLGAALKGLGHAGKATIDEAGKALKSGTGLAPPSPASEDGRGRKVSSLGTRAANNLHQKAQEVSEKTASTPVVPETGPEQPEKGPKPDKPEGDKPEGDKPEKLQPGTPDPKDPVSPTEAKPPQAPVSPQGTTAGTSAGGDAPPASPATPSTPAEAPPAGKATAGTSPAAGQSAQPAAPSNASATAGTPPAPGKSQLLPGSDSKTMGSALKPPTLPPSDAAQGGVTINIQTIDD